MQISSGRLRLQAQVLSWKHSVSELGQVPLRLLISCRLFVLPQFYLHLVLRPCTDNQRHASKIIQSAHYDHFIRHSIPAEGATRGVEMQVTEIWIWNEMQIIHTHDQPTNALVGRERERDQRQSVTRDICFSTRPHSQTHSECLLLVMC